MVGRKQIAATNEGIHVEEMSACYLCGMEGLLLYENLRDRLFTAPGTWSLMRCSQCDLAWLNPQPVASDISKLYAEYYTHQLKDVPKKRLGSMRKAVEGHILQKEFGYSLNVESGLLVRILSWLGPIKEVIGGSVMYLNANNGGRLLDVGCGNGRFLAQMRELGWEVTGVEPDPIAVQVARERFGLEVFQGTLEEAGFPDNSFDAITMNHVIEHVPDPIGLLTECRRLLKPGGKLVVVTPNIRSLGARLFGEAWRGWEPPRHLFLFSPKSLRVCAQRAGLQVQALWTTSKGARYFWAATRLIRRDGRLPGGQFQQQGLLRLEGLAFWAVECALCWVGQFGEEVVLVGVK